MLHFIRRLIKKFKSDTLVECVTCYIDEVEQKREIETQSIIIRYI